MPKKRWMEANCFHSAAPICRLPAGPGRGRELFCRRLTSIACHPFSSDSCFGHDGIASPSLASTDRHMGWAPESGLTSVASTSCGMTGTWFIDFCLLTSVEWQLQLMLVGPCRCCCYSGSVPTAAAAAAPTAPSAAPAAAAAASSWWINFEMDNEARLTLARSRAWHGPQRAWRLNIKVDCFQPDVSFLLGRLGEVTFRNRIHSDRFLKSHHRPRNTQVGSSVNYCACTVQTLY